MGITAPDVNGVPLGPPDTGVMRVVVFSGGGSGEPFLLLRRHSEASVYLGGFLDAAGKVHELVEVWVQRVAGFAAAYPGTAWTNTKLDQRWVAMREELAVADGTSLCLGFEDLPGPPLWLEPSADAGEWELCRNDTALRASGLPAYGDTLHRYLLNRESGEWIALNSDAPLNGIAKRLSEVHPGRKCFNPEGGGIFCRPAGVIAWRDFAGCLRGGRWQPDLDAAWIETLPGVYQELAAEHPGESHWRHYLLPSMGAPAFAAEALYLRLALLHGAIEAVATAISHRGSPFLNLDDGHFGIRLSDPGCGLPSLWTARVVLQRGGGAVASGPENRFFVADALSPPGPFRLPGPVRTIRCSGSLRVRKVGETVSGQAVVEATLQTAPQFSGADGFRLEIHFEGASGVVALEGEIAAGASPCEWLFAGKIPADRGAMLVEGATYPQVDVLLHPKLGSACDIYSLGVLGLQIFLETAERPLATVLDDALLLRERLPAGTTAASMPAAVGRLLDDFSGLRMPEQRQPDGLWHETLACLIRMLGGKGEASFFKGPADGLEEPPVVLHHAPLAEVAGLLQRARSRVVGGQGRNREVREEILRLIAELKVG